MVLPLLAAILIPQLVAVGAVFLNELVKGPLSSRLSEVFPHEKPQVRMLVQAVINGSITVNEFETASAITDIRDPDRSFLIKHALNLRFQRESAEAAQTLKPLLAQFTKNLEELGDATFGETEREIKIVDSELDSVERELRKTILDQAEEELQPDIDELEEQTSILERKIAPVKAAIAKLPEVAPPLLFSEFKVLATNVAVDLIAGVLEQGFEPTADEVADAIVPSIFNLQLLTADQLKFAEEKLFLDRFRVFLPDLIDKLAVAHAKR